MCPSYMATREEQDSTRGRANLFRQIFRGERIDAFSSTDLKKGMDLCLSCKACKSECPANVDMAKLKAEFTQGWHKINGASLSEHFFARSELVFPLASTFAGIVNFMNRTPVAKEIFKTFFNIHPERNLPNFATVTFEKWFKRRSLKTETGPPVLVMVDLFMNYNEPEIGIAMVSVLEKLGYRVIITKPTQSGRTHLSKGFVEDAKKIATKNIRTLSPYAEKGIPVIGQEPSEILTLRDEYLDLCDETDLDDAKILASSTYMFEEFVLQHLSHHPEDVNLFTAVKGVVHVHGHCHAKALVGMKPVMELFNVLSIESKNLNSGCCGMAGSFGYEANHYDVSLKIGEATLFPKIRALDENAEICAHGFSCRHQISDVVDRKSRHTAVILSDYLKS
jgi:Fe-S oxidoreductase